MANLVIDASFMPLLVFLKENATIVQTENKRYFFLPFWMEEQTDQERPYSSAVKLVLHNFENLPQDLQDAIKGSRDNLIFQLENGI